MYTLRMTGDREITAAPSARTVFATSEFGVAYKTSSNATLFIATLGFGTFEARCASHDYGFGVVSSNPVLMFCKIKRHTKAPASGIPMRNANGSPASHALPPAPLHSFRAGPRNTSSFL